MSSGESFASTWSRPATMALMGVIFLLGGDVMELRLLPFVRGFGLSG
jgi:hypothetical protein